MDHIVINVVDISKRLKSLLLATVGNLMGGSFFVALLNYAHIREMQRAVID